MEGRDCLDVALFQCGGLGQPRAVRFLFARGSSPALSYRSDGRKLVVGRRGRSQQAAPGNDAPQLLGAHAGGLRRSLSSGGAFREFYAIVKTAYILSRLSMHGAATIEGRLSCRETRRRRPLSRATSGSTPTTMWRSWSTIWDCPQRPAFPAVWSCATSCRRATRSRWPIFRKAPRSAVTTR